MTTLLRVAGLRVTYGGLTAIDDVSFDVPAGGIVGLIGPNGAGKTTLIDALTGYTRAAAGRITLDGKDITAMPAFRRARIGLGRTFQTVELFDDLTIDENLRVAAAQRARPLRRLVSGPGEGPRAAVDWALAAAGLQDVAHESPRALSHGRRKLVGVARALARRPDLLLLDEPAAGLDTHETTELAGWLRELPAQGVTLLLVDHDMSLVLSVCDQVTVLDFGRLIACGTPDEIRNDPAVQAAYLGSRTELEGKPVG